MKCEIHGTTLKTYRTDQLGGVTIREKYCLECNPQTPEGPPQIKIRTIEKTESAWEDEIREYREKIEDLERELKQKFEDFSEMEKRIFNYFEAEKNLKELLKGALT